GAKPRPAAANRARLPRGPSLVAVARGPRLAGRRGSEIHRLVRPDSSSTPRTSWRHRDHPGGSAAVLRAADIQRAVGGRGPVIIRGESESEDTDRGWRPRIFPHARDTVAPRPRVSRHRSG